MTETAGSMERIQPCLDCGSKQLLRERELTERVTIADDGALVSTTTEDSGMVYHYQCEECGATFSPSTLAQSQVEA